MRRCGREDSLGLTEAAVDFFKPAQEARYGTGADGDVLADRDGVVIIPAAIAAEVVQETEEVLRKENLVRKAILQGIDPVQAYLQYGKF